MFLRKVIGRWSWICSVGLGSVGLLRAQGVMSLSLTIAPDTVVQYGDSVKFTVRMAYDHPASTPFFGGVSFRYQTPLGVFDSITPVPSSYLIVGSGGFVNSTFYIPVTPSAFLTGGGGNPIVIWPVLVPDTSLTPGNVLVKDSVKVTLYVLPLGHPESSEDFLHFYPNPFREYLFIRYDGTDQEAVLAVHDALGRLVSSCKMAMGNNVLLNTAHWPEGMLVLRLTSPSGLEIHRKILCRRH